MPTLQGFDILAFTYADWFASWSTPQQILSRLAPENRVLFVDQPRSFLRWLKPRDPQGAGEWEGESLREVQPNLFVYHLPHAFVPVGKLPFPAARLALNMNGRLMAPLIRRQMRRLNMKAPILWNFSPLHGGAVSSIPHEVEIYDICDEWANYVSDSGGKQVLQWIERQLIRKADLNFVGTAEARALREGMNAEIHVVHHGADYQHFATAAAAETSPPEDLAEIAHPVIGYVGVMDPQRFDVDLVASVAEAHPDWSVVLVGPARAEMNLGRLKSCANVYLTGNRQIADLPRYLKGMDAVLIPYKLNEATANIYPLKLQEYLATGKPVISTPLPAVKPYSEVVYLAEDAAAFTDAIARALHEDAPEKRAARQAVARENSWEHRVREKSQHVLRVLQRKNPAGGVKAG